MSRIPLVFFGCLMIVNIASNFLEKKGMTLLPRITSFQQLYSIETIKALILNPYIVSGVALSVLGIFLWFGALSSLKLSYLVPLSGIAYILTTLVSWLFLSEDISTIQWAGVIVITIGVFLINQ